MQVKTSLRLYLTPVRIATIKNTATDVGEDVGEKEPTYTADGNVN
jgi:hypothetical protein